jgi:hypothetical protein
MNKDKILKELTLVTGTHGRFQELISMLLSVASKEYVPVEILIVFDFGANSRMSQIMQDDVNLQLAVTLLEHKGVTVIYLFTSMNTSSKSLGLGNVRTMQFSNVQTNYMVYIEDDCIPEGEYFKDLMLSWNLMSDLIPMVGGIGGVQKAFSIGDEQFLEGSWKDDSGEFLPLPEHGTVFNLLTPDHENQKMRIHKKFQVEEYFCDGVLNTLKYPTEVFINSWSYRTDLVSDLNMDWLLYGGYSEEAAHSLHVRKKGYALYIDPSLKVYHLRNLVKKSYGRSPEKEKEARLKNSRLVYSKYKEFLKDK